MIKRETELQKYLSNKEENLRDQEINTKIEASIENLLESTGSPIKSIDSANVMSKQPQVFASQQI